MNPKDLVQLEAVNAWWSNPRATLNMCTGSGKTYTALRIIKRLFEYLKKEDFKCLIIVPTEIIRDKVFPEEFSNFKLDYLRKYCDIECIQTVYKYSNKEYDLVVVDEIHNICPKVGESYEYFKFFENNKYKYLLGLSASIDNDKLPMLNTIAPISYILPLDKAVSLGIVSPFEIYNVEVSLTEEEQKALNSVNSTYNYYERLLGGPFEAFTAAKQAIKSDNIEVKKIGLIYHAMIKKRKKILDSAFNKEAIVKYLLNFMFSDKNGIIFSESIDKAVSLVRGEEKAVVYHSKMNKKEKDYAINRLNDGRTKTQYISAVKALNEGLSINSVYFAIITAGNSKVKDMIQRIGRSCRFVEGKKAIIIRLYVKNTQEEKWVKKSLIGFNPDNIFFLTLDELCTKLNKP